MRRRRPRLNRDNLASGKVVVRANDAELTRRNHFSQYRLLGLQAAHVGLHVCYNGSLFEIRSRDFQDRLNGGLHGADKASNMTWKRIALLKGFNRRVDRSTTSMTQYHDHLGAQHCNPILKATQSVWCYEIAGDTYDEKFARCLVKCEFRSNS